METLHYWYKGHGLHLPWFHISVSLRGKDGPRSRIVFASTLDQLLDLRTRRGSRRTFNPTILRLYRSGIRFR